MDKIPEHLRPSVEECWKFLHGLSPELVRLFRLDLQNDCTCEFETYEAESGMLFIQEGQVVEVHNDRRLRVYMSPSPASDDLIRSLVMAALPGASISPDVVATIQVATDEAFEYWADPDYFGILIANLRGWGAFVIPRTLERRSRT